MPSLSYFSRRRQLKMKIIGHSVLPRIEGVGATREDTMVVIAPKNEFGPNWAHFGPGSKFIFSTFTH